MSSNRDSKSMFMDFSSLKEHDLYSVAKFRPSAPTQTLTPNERRFQILTGLSQVSGGGSAFVSKIRRKNFNCALPLHNLNWHSSTKPRAMTTARCVRDALQAEEKRIPRSQYDAYRCASALVLIYLRCGSKLLSGNS